MYVCAFLIAARDGELGFWQLSHILGFRSALVHAHPGVLHICILPTPTCDSLHPCLRSLLPSSLHPPRETSCEKTRLIFHRVYKSLKLCTVLPFFLFFNSSKPSWNVAVFAEKNQRKGIIITGQVLSGEQLQALGAPLAWASFVSAKSQAS